MSTKRRVLGKQSGVRSTVTSYNNNLKTAVLLESNLEVDYYRMMEFILPEGATLEMQPEHIELVIDGKRIRYTPDAKITMSDGRITMHEIKYEKDIHVPRTREKLIKAKWKYASMNIRFDVITEREIRKGCQAENFSHLLAALHHEIPLDTFKLLVSDLPPQEYSIKEMSEIALSKGMSESIVKIAMAHMLFDWDTTLAWSDIRLGF